MLQTDRIVGLLEPRLQFGVEVVDGSDRHEVSAPLRTIVLLSSHSGAVQPAMERETRDEMLLARREPGEADARNADESRLLRNDLNVAETAQEVDESPREMEDGSIGASEEGLEREASTGMPQVPCDETRTTLRAGPHRVLRAWHARSVLVQDAIATRRSSDVGGASPEVGAAGVVTRGAGGARLPARYSAGRPQGDRDEAPEETVLPTVRTGSEDDRVGVAADLSVANAQAPQPVDQDRLAKRIHHRPEERAAAWIERVNAAVAEVADQNRAGEGAEARRRLHQPPRRVEMTVLGESRQHPTARIERVHDAMTVPRHIVVLRSILPGIGDEQPAV